MSGKVRMVDLPGGEAVPALGQGSCGWAEDPGRRDEELVSLRQGIDLGLGLVDTAEMYADGAAEELIGAGIAGRRDEVFLVTKVLPHHATRTGTVAACENSLRRLGTDRVDLYLLHWRGSVPLAETLEGFTALVSTGKIRHWGVSNFDTDDLTELDSLAAGGDVATNQVLYNLSRRGIEYDLLPRCQDHNLPVMAYSPVEQGRILDSPTLAEIAVGHGVTPPQVALAWVLRQDGLIAIPRAGTREHVRDNRAALDLVLDDADIAVLDAAFPPPVARQPLEIL